MQKEQTGCDADVVLCDFLTKAQNYCKNLHYTQIKLQKSAFYAFRNSEAAIENMTMKIGHVIRNLRNAKKATLADIAFAVETDAANLSRIEREEQNPSPDLADKLAREFDVPVSAFYLMAEQTLALYQVDGNREEMKQARQRLDTFVSRFMLLSAANQDLINEFLEVLLKAERRAEQSVSKDSLPL